MSYIQAILFDDSLYDTKKALQWLRKHNYTPIKRVHRTNNYLRYRLVEPNDTDRYRTKKITDGIKFIIGYS